MRTESKTHPKIVVQSVVPASLADELRTRADSERRSVSSLIRLAIEDALHRRDQEARR